MQRQLLPPLPPPFDMLDLLDHYGAKLLVSRERPQEAATAADLDPREAEPPGPVRYDPLHVAQLVQIAAGEEVAQRPGARIDHSLGRHRRTPADPELDVATHDPREDVVRAVGPPRGPERLGEVLPWPSARPPPAPRSRRPAGSSARLRSARDCHPVDPVGLHVVRMAQGVGPAALAGDPGALRRRVRRHRRQRDVARRAHQRVGHRRRCLVRRKGHLGHRVHLAPQQLVQLVQQRQPLHRGQRDELPEGGHVSVSACS